MIKIIKHSLGTIWEPHDPVKVYEGEIYAEHWEGFKEDFKIRGTMGGKYEALENGFKYTTSNGSIITYTTE